MILRLIVLLHLSFTACSAPVVPEGDYYFPVRNFQRPTSYYFEDQNGSGRKTVWKMQMEVSGRDTVLVTEILDQSGQRIERMKEKIKGGRALLLHYEIYGGGELPISQGVKIKDNIVFDFHQQPGETIRWESVLTLSNSNITLSKSRLLLRQENHERHFEDQMHSEEEGARPLDYTVFTVYELNKGLTSYRIVQGGEERFHFVLVKIETQ